MKALWNRLADMARLMVGVGSYEKYVQHMRACHRNVTPMTETEYFRHCQNSRYPSDKNRSLKRCPC